jgi:chromosomal replication initiator protein
VGEKMMRLESRDEVWPGIREDLCVRIGRDRFDRWLAPLSLVECGEDEVRLGTPNKFWLEWIEERYLGEVAAALERKAGRAVRVRLAIDPELFRRMRKSQGKILGDLRRPGEPPEPEISAERVTRGMPGAAGRLASPAIDGPPPPAAGSPWRPGPETQTLDSFVVGRSNRMAHRAALDVVENPGGVYNPLFIHGGCGLGKTHLLRGIRQAILDRHPGLAARYLTGEEFLNQFVAHLQAKTILKFREKFRSPQVLVIDDIHLLG